MNKPDPRIPAMLELAELKYRIDDDGDAIVMIRSSGRFFPLRTQVNSLLPRCLPIVSIRAVA